MDRNSEEHCSGALWLSYQCRRAILVLVQINHYEPGAELSGSIVAVKLFHEIRFTAPAINRPQSCARALNYPLHDCLVESSLNSYGKNQGGGFGQFSNV